MVSFFNIRLESDDQKYCENEIREVMDDYFARNNIRASYSLSDNTYIAIRTRRKKNILMWIPQDDIIYIEKERHKVKLYTKNGEYSYYTTLKELEKRLNPEQFMRVHQGYIVNILDVECLYENELYMLSTDKIIPVSRRNKSKINKMAKPDKKL